MASEGNGFTSAATQVYEEYLTSTQTGDESDFASICSAHPALADELRRLHSMMQRLQQALPGRSLSTRLEERYGSLVDPRITLTGADDGPEGTGFSSEVLARLAERRGNFGRYVLRGEIARGGQGVVVRVWDEDLRRALAMKVLLDKKPTTVDAATPQVESGSLGRFLEEAQVTGQLDHPGIVPVHEIGLDYDGRVYFTMKLVKGRTLKAVLELVAKDAEGWTQTRALGVLSKVCDAMSYAHHKGVVHRDLKPGNVMVGRFGEVYVMDWGLAKVLGREDKKNVSVLPQPVTQWLRTDRRAHAEASPDSPLLTMDGDVVGTPAYMPPEQALGLTEMIGPHSDVYAVGAMLYHLIAGHMPYVEPGMRLSNYAIWYLVQKGAPTPLMERAPRTPVELVAICERAMAREVERRYPDMSALAADLSAYMEQRVVAAYETGAWAEAKKWVQRNKPLAASLAAAMALFMASALSILWLKARSDDNARRAEENERLALELTNQLLSPSASHDLENLAAQAEELWPVHPRLLADYELWLDAAQELLDGRPEDPERGIRKRPDLDELTAELLELRLRAQPLSAEVAQADRKSHPRYAELTWKLDELQWRARMLGSEPWPDEAQDQTSLAWEELPHAASGLNALAWSLADPDRPEYGSEIRALLIAERALAAANDSERADVHHTLAWALFRAGRHDQALAEAKRARDEFEPGRAQTFVPRFDALIRAIAGWQGEDALAARRREFAELASEVELLERIVAERRTWKFESTEDGWRHAQISMLVAELEALRDPVTGLMGDTLAEPFGWGITRRLEFARTIAERSVTWPEAKRRWDEALAAIAASDKYAGLELRPQMGLLPLGPDPRSGLWEFAHLATGEPAVRAADGELILREETGLVFVLLPGGRFLMGSQKDDPEGANYYSQATKREAPVHDVIVRPFFYSKYAMTQAQWLRFAGRNPSQYQPPLIEAPSLLHPVERVSWSTCMKMCARLGLSLPSEAQWEYGARGGTDTPWWTGSEERSLLGAAKLAGLVSVTPESIEPGETYVAHAPVNHFRPNPFGLHSVYGNVWEWCLDGYEEVPYGSRSRSGSASAAAEPFQRVNRGGGYVSAPARARSAYRSGDPPEYASAALGLRPTKAIEP